MHNYHHSRNASAEPTRRRSAPIPALYSSFSMYTIKIAGGAKNTFAVGKHTHLTTHAALSARHDGRHQKSPSVAMLKKSGVEPSLQSAATAGRCAVTLTDKMYRKNYACVANPRAVCCSFSPCNPRPQASEGERRAGTWEPTRRENCGPCARRSAKPEEPTADGSRGARPG